MCKCAITIETRCFVWKLDFALQWAQHVATVRAVTRLHWSFSFASFLWGNMLSIGCCVCNCDVVWFPVSHFRVIENIICWRLLYKVSSKVYALSFCLTSGALSNRQNLKNLTPCLLLNKRRNKTQTQLVPLMTIEIASMYMWLGVNGPSLDR